MVVIRRCVVVVDTAHTVFVALECLRPEDRTLLFFARLLAGSVVFAAVVSARTVVLLSLSVVVVGLRVGAALSQVTAFSFATFIAWWDDCDVDELGVDGDDVHSTGRFHCYRQILLHVREVEIEVAFLGHRHSKAALRELGIGPDEDAGGNCAMSQISCYPDVVTVVDGHFLAVVEIDLSFILGRVADGEFCEPARLEEILISRYHFQRMRPDIEMADVDDEGSVVIEIDVGDPVTVERNIENEFIKGFVDDCHLDGKHLSNDEIARLFSADRWRLFEADAVDVEVEDPDHDAANHQKCKYQTAHLFRILHGTGSRVECKKGTRRNSRVHQRCTTD